MIGDDERRRNADVAPATCSTQVQNGKFVRVTPTKKGTFDCNAANHVTVKAGPDQVTHTEVE